MRQISFPNWPFWAVAAGLLLWLLPSFWLLIFAAILFAILLRALADLVSDHSFIASPWSVALVGLILLSALAAFSVLFGATLGAEMTRLWERLPEFIAMLERKLGVEGIEQWLASRLEDSAERGSLAGRIAGYSSWVIGLAANALVILVAGAYLAAQPDLYRNGFLRLLPQRHRQSVERTMTEAGNALKRWLVGRLAAMVMVGMLTTGGLMLIGTPSPIALGFIAGLLEFVPYIGPPLSAIPALAIALAESPVLAAWTAGLYLLIQQIEGYLITPLVQQKAVHLPPAVTIFAVVGMGLLLGPIGIVLATPLAVVVVIAVKNHLVGAEPGESAYSQGT